ncbi:hypothetical protein ScPMuIL_016952 [Solemya velum]
MVMHARKHPRLNDGYVDKRETGALQSSQYPSKSYSGNSRDRYSKMRNSPSDRTRDDSSPTRNSPRYSHKSSHIERSKEKLEKGAVTSPEKHVNHAPTTSSQRCGYISGSNNIERGSKNGRSDPKDQKEKDHKSEVQKSAKRVSGDWSEHTSSSGKRYYYNIKTEVSQWEKPKEWSEVHLARSDGKSKDSHSHDRASQLSKATESRNRHSSSGESSGLRHERINMGAPDNKPDKKLLFDRLQAGLRTSHLQHKMPFPLDQSKPDSQTFVRKLSTGKPETVIRRDNSGKSDSHSHFYSRKESAVPFSSQDYSSARRARQNSEGSRSSGHITTRKYNDQHFDDMEISPGSTPTSSRPSSAGTPQIGSINTSASLSAPVVTLTGSAGLSTTPAPLISKLPQLITQLSGGQNNQEATQKALETLQKLQEVLSHQIQKSSTANQMHSPRATADLASLQQSMKAHLTHSQQQLPQTQPTTSHSQTQYSPHIPPVSQPTNVSPQQLHTTGIYGRVNQHNQHAEPRGGESPRSDCSDRSCHSPAASNTSSQDAPVDNSSLPSTPVKAETSMGLTPSLSNYYSERLIGHTLGWQADHAERQANRYWEEGLSVGSLHCSQVSVDLKRARSLVRVSEIQSTLHEQRILFLAQQIKELESMKPPSFMSTQ